MRAIFTVDGGNATGIAWGIYDDQCGSVAEALASRRASGSATLNRRYVANKTKMFETKTFDPNLVICGNTPFMDHTQVQMIYTAFTAFKRECYYGHEIELDNIDLVLEDFILLPGPHAGGKDGVASVRITWGIVGYQMGVANEFSRRHRNYHITPITWQTPSQQGRITDEWLRKNGVWVKGRDHENTAVKHIVVRLNTVMK